MHVEEMRAQALDAVKRLPEGKLDALPAHLRSLDASRDKSRREFAHDHARTFRPSGSAIKKGISKYRGVIRVGAGDIGHDIESARQAMAEEALDPRG